MATTQKVSFPFPVIVETGGFIPVVSSSNYGVIAGDTPAACAPYSWMTATGATAPNLKPMASAADTAALVVSKIIQTNGSEAPNQYQAASTSYSVEGWPIGGLIFYAEEDADTTPITDANAGPGIYADLIVGTIDRSGAPGATIDDNTIYDWKAIPNIKIDSSSVNSSASGLLVELLGLAPIDPMDGGNPYSATSLASPRIFKMRVIPADATINQ